MAVCGSPSSPPKLSIVRQASNQALIWKAHIAGCRRSRKDQTLNTPAVATLIMMENQIRWLNNNGGLAWATTRCAKSASILYSWAERSEYAAPFVVDADARSNAVVTIDLDERVQASQVLSILRENGIVDAAGYRKLGRNQLRVGVFPSVEPADVMAFTKCVDYVVEHL